jgi:hypothetical protein
MWELLTGERMYKRETDYKTMEAIVLDPPRPPSTVRADIPPELDAIVMKMVAKVPGDRYQTTDELHDDIERVADALGIRISTAALKRFFVELFGKRPEPWIEHQVKDLGLELVTVSVAAVGHRETVVTKSIMDSELYSVPDLTRTPSAPRRTPTPVPFKAVDGDEPDTILEVQPAKSPYAGIRPTNVAKKESTISSTDNVRADGDHDDESRRPLVGALLIAAAVAGVIWYAFLRHDTAPQVAVAAPIPPSAPSTRQTIVTPDAAPILTPPLVTPPVAPEHVASTNPETAGSDATSGSGSATETSKPIKHVKKSDPVRTTPASQDDFAANLRAGKYSDIVVACLVSSKQLAQHLTTCTFAACQVHDAANARAWFGNLPANKRDAIATQCTSAGTPVGATATVKPKCTDPMECRK